MIPDTTCKSLLVWRARWSPSVSCSAVASCGGCVAVASRPLHKHAVSSGYCLKGSPHDALVSSYPLELRRSTDLTRTKEPGCRNYICLRCRARKNGHAVLYACHCTPKAICQRNRYYAHLKSDCRVSSSCAAAWREACTSAVAPSF